MTSKKSPKIEWFYPIWLESKNLYFFWAKPESRSQLSAPIQRIKGDRSLDSTKIEIYRDCGTLECLGDSDKPLLICEETHLFGMWASYDHIKPS